MRIHAVFISVLLLSIGCSEHKTADPGTMKSVVEAYYDGIRDHDRRKMTEATTDDFLLYEQGKVWNNDSVFHEMDLYPYRVKFSFGQLHATGNHLSWQTHADFTFEDSIRIGYDFLESAMFMKDGDAWRMRFLHVTTARATRYDTIHYAPGYYAERVGAFTAEPVKKGGIIFLGNSIIEYGDWRSLLNDASVVNRGIAADNTFGVLRRLNDVIGRMPGKLFIEIGINDISQDIPTDIIVENIITIINRIHDRSPGTMICFISILPTNDNVKNEYPDAFNKNHVTDEVNNRLRSKSESGSFTFIDFNTVLRDHNNKLDEKYAQPDGLHLNEDGYKLLVEMLVTKGYIAR